MGHSLVKQNREGISLPDVFFKKNYLKIFEEFTMWQIYTYDTVFLKRKHAALLKKLCSFHVLWPIRDHPFSTYVKFPKN